MVPPAAGEEVTVSDNDSSGEAEVSENETAPSVSDDVVSGDEADEVSGKFKHIYKDFE